MTTANWFIDTWSPRDGIGFASLRERVPLVDEEEAWLRDIKRTVSMRPPSWEAVEARPSTAFRAERLGFQFGFFTNAQTEIAFDSLEEIAEVMRRAFVASGGDAEPGPEPAEREPTPPESGPSEGNEHVEHILKVTRTLTQKARALDDLTARSAPLDERMKLASQCTGHMGPGLDQALQEVAMKIALHFESLVIAAPNQRFIPSYFTWLGLMLRCGLVDPYHLYNHCQSDDTRAALQAPRWNHPYYAHGAYFPSERSLRPSASLHHVPMPPDSNMRSRKERLIDRLLYILASEDAWLKIKNLDELATVLIAACTIRGQQPGAWSYRWDPQAKRTSVVQASLAWLLGELPVPLTNSDARMALESFVAHETAP